MDSPRDSHADVDVSRGRGVVPTVATGDTEGLHCHLKLREVLLFLPNVRTLDICLGELRSWQSSREAKGTALITRPSILLFRF